MSNLKESENLLKRFAKARIPFIVIDTIEHARALSIIKNVSQEVNTPFLVHTLSKGLYNLQDGSNVNDDNSIYSALDFVSEQMKNGVQNLTLVLTEISNISTDTDTAKKLLDLVNLAVEVGGSVITISNNSVWSQLQRQGMSIKLDLPNENEMTEIINNQLQPYKSQIQIDWDENSIQQASSYLSGTTQIEAENIIASLIANGRITNEDLKEVQTAKDRLFNDISGLERIEIDDNIQQVGGLSGLKKWLTSKRKLLTPEKRAELKNRGLRPPRGVLLVGVPGCGKSLSAKAIAANWNLPLYRLDFATVQGSYVGQTEQQLRDALNTADQVSPCVLWIDEIEKGLSGASSANDGGVSTRMVGQFLFWLQESRKQVFVVATANDVSKLPAELLRRGRFDELFFVDLPTADERREILSLYMAKYLNKNFVGEFADKIVEMSEGFSGADLESAIRDLAYDVMSGESNLSAQDIVDEFNNVVPLSQTSPEKISAIREWGKSRAVPASGHPIGEQAVSKTSEARTRRVLL